MIYDVKNISFTYPSRDAPVLNNVSLTLEKGEILSVLGPNGAGKSTLLGCLTGLLSVLSGSISVNGRDISDISRRETAKVIGYVPQSHSPVFSYTVLHFVMLGRAPHVGAFSKPKKEDEETAYDALKTLSIEHLALRPYTQLSGGERQQAVIARTLAQQPEAILFDEPTAHLDYGNQHRILNLIKTLSNDGYGIIITTHNPDHALMLGGRAAIIDRNGNVDSGGCGEIITEDKLKEVYNTDLRLLYVEQLARTVCLPAGLPAAAISQSANNNRGSDCANS